MSKCLLIVFYTIAVCAVLVAPAQAQFPCGDVNDNGSIDIIDFVNVVNYIVDTDSTIARPDLADVNSLPGINAADVVYLVDFFFLGGPAPCNGGPAGDDMLPGGEVTLEYVAGQSGPSVVAAGFPLTFNVRVTNNTDRRIRGMANGFTLYSPDGANIGNVGLPDDSVWWDELGMASRWTYDPAVGESFGNMSFAFPILHGWEIDTTEELGFQPGATGISYSINLEPFGDEDIGKTICFDSAFYGNGGEWVWAVDGNNTLQPSWDGPHCYTIEEATYIPGDIDWDGEIAISDLVWLVDYMFTSGPAPPIMEACDLNGDCTVPDISDLVYMVEYMFLEGDAPLFSCTRPAGKIAPAGDRVTLTSYVENGVTTVEVSSKIDIAGIQLELTSSDVPRGVQGVTDRRIEVVHGYANDRLRVGVLDLDGGVTMKAGDFTLIRIDGECQLVSATVADLNATSIQPTLIQGKNSRMPANFTLHQNYPNPFNGSTVISFRLEQGSEVQLKIFDLTGREVTVLADRTLTAGQHSFTWNGKTSDGSETASGVYFYRLTAGGADRTQKMMYLK